MHDKVYHLYYNLSPTLQNHMYLVIAPFHISGYHGSIFIKKVIVDHIESKLEHQKCGLLALQAATIKLLSLLGLPHFLNNIARDDTFPGIIGYFHLMDKNGRKEQK